MTTAVRTVLAPMCAVGALIVMSTPGDVSGQQAAACGMQRNEAPVVFCETFDQPFPVANRAGQLNGTLWGVSRLRGQGTHWATSTLDACDGPRPASPIGATDLIVCNGRLRESTNDDGDVTVLAMYPKQPFDFADRTGTVSFDVSNDTAGIHASWPEFWLTDQPVPAPFWHSDCAFCSLPRNALGIRFSADRGGCPGGWKADSAIVVRNYVAENKENWHPWQPPVTGLLMQETGCAGLSPGPNGGLNHVEIRISKNQVDIYASDPGSTALHQINSITNANLSFTRGLVWIEDAHYNADKAVGLNGVPSQRDHTYTWDNVAFDGPATYRDLSFDVLDAGVPRGSGLFDLGWTATPASPATLATLPITAANIAAARNALLMFNFGLYSSPSTFTYVINGHENTAPSPLPVMPHGVQSVAFPVPLEHLVPGPQKIVLSSNEGIGVSNVNIVLVAAAPVPGSQVVEAPTNLHILQN